ncbi:hypothetical protein HanIR_Chr10g0475421 [Helianthus annuus]|nr:hypothetical protein HanIR_Chr10g0475421 [Helianthus annuus]
MWKYLVNIELLSLSATLCSKKINIDQIVLLIGKYYPKDFTEQERNQLHGQLETFKVERINNAKLLGYQLFLIFAKFLWNVRKIICTNWLKECVG